MPCTPVRHFVCVYLLTSYPVTCIIQQLHSSTQCPIACLVLSLERLVLSLCDRVCMRWLRCLQLLPPRTLLVVCLLVCWLGREAVSHVDLIRGAMLGHVPFLDMPVRCKDLLQTPAGHGLPVSAMKSATAYGTKQALSQLSGVLASSCIVSGGCS